jgi:hypothetical protein
MKKRHKIKVVQPIAFIDTSKRFIGYIISSLFDCIKNLFIEKEFERYMFILLLH